jgi:glyoxylase I family protein
MKTARSQGIPGLTGVEHIGFTVPNIEEATAFFVEVIGCEAVYDAGPFQSDTDWMTTHLNVHREAVTKLRFLRCANGPNIELFEYESPDQNAVQPKNCDVGGHHLAFYVTDLDAAVEHLRNHNVRVLGEPTANTGPSEGQRWVYFLTPWDMQLELVSFPEGKACEKEASIRPWRPE